MPSIINEKEYINDKEAAEILNVTWQVLAQWRSRYKKIPSHNFTIPYIPYLKVGKKVYYEKADILKFLEDSTHKK